PSFPLCMVFRNCAFVVIADTRRIRCEIRTTCLLIRDYDQVPASEVHTGKQLATLIAKRVTPLTTTELDEICAPLHRRGGIPRWNGSVHGDRVRSNDIKSFRWRKCVSDRGNGTQVNNNRS